MSEGRLASEKDPISALAESRNRIRKMNPEKFNEQILSNAVQMDASVNFQLNGNMLIVPCPWEDDKQVTNGERVRYRAGIEVDADGRTRIKRYNDGKNGPMHDTLYETAHGAVKITRPQIRPYNGRRRMDEEFVYAGSSMLFT